MERALGHQRASRRSGTSLGTTRSGTRSQKRLWKGSEAINPQGWEKGSLSETPPLHFCGFPFLEGIPAVQVTAAYARHTQACVGRQYAVSTRTDFFEGRFFVKTSGQRWEAMRTRGWKTRRRHWGIEGGGGASLPLLTLSGGIFAGCCIGLENFRYPTEFFFGPSEPTSDNLA